MAIKKGDLVKVIELVNNDEELYGIELDGTYEVLCLHIDCIGVCINAGKGDRIMYNYQLEKVKKKKSRKDLRIEELENEIREMKNRLELLVINN